MSGNEPAAQTHRGASRSDNRISPALKNFEKPKIENLQVELGLWRAYREIYRAKGIDIAEIHAEWAADRQQQLTSPGAGEDFAELCKDGCHPIALAALVALLRNSPLMEGFWTEMVGQPRNRQKAARTLEGAAETLERTFSKILAVKKDGERVEFMKLGRLPISKLVSELRFYVRFFNFAKSLCADTETRSLGQFSRYLLTSYVYRITGHFHDRNVSGLIGEVLGPTDCTKEAQTHLCGEIRQPDNDAHQYRSCE
jgi:hypothetical protein